MSATGRVDSHLHVWDRSCPIVAGSRYHPDYEATIETCLALLDAHDVERAVLVQPSFLGTDNSYLLRCLDAFPDRLRGIVVVGPETPLAEIEDMRAKGVIGHRYNLLSLAPDALATDPYRTLTSHAAASGWWTEVQAPWVVWPGIVPILAEDRARVMVDHFGLPSGAGCPGIEAIRTLPGERVCLKLSAPYRQKSADYRAAVEPWINAWAAPNLLWGSDWPWTQHEGQHSYRDCMDWLDTWTNAHMRRALEGAAALSGFDDA